MFFAYLEAFKLSNNKDSRKTLILALKKTLEKELEIPSDKSN